MLGKLSLVGLMLVIATLLVGCIRPMAQEQITVVSHVSTLQEKFREGAVEAAPGTTAVAATPTGWATLKGKFTMQGAPAPSVLSITKEQDVCMPGGKPVLSERLIVDSSGGVKDVLVYLSTKTPVTPEWEHPSYADTKTSTVEFDQKDCIFLSHTFAVRSTQTVKILNSDPVGHNTNIPSKGNMAPANPTVPSNSSVTYEPKGESGEPTPVSCSIHPWMSANMIARDNPYFAVTKPDGTFEIANIPAGVDLEFRIWHESVGFVGKATGIEPDKKGKVKLKAENDQVVEWNVEIPAP